jgi:hypothetical protein
MLLLHGEQYLELARPFPSCGEFTTTTRVIDVLDKGKGAVLVLGMTTSDAVTQEVVAENETTVYLRGSGGFGKSEYPPPPSPFSPSPFVMYVQGSLQENTLERGSVEPR